MRHTRVQPHRYNSNKHNHFQHQKYHPRTNTLSLPPEPSAPHISSMLHPSSNTDDTAVRASGTVDPPHNSASTTSPPPVERQSSVSKVAQVAKNLIKSPAEEKEHLKLEKTLSKEAKKGEVDVGVMEV